MISPSNIIIDSLGDIDDHGYRRVDFHLNGSKRIITASFCTKNPGWSSFNGNVPDEVVKASQGLNKSISRVFEEGGFVYQLEKAINHWEEIKKLKQSLNPSTLKTFEELIDEL